MWKTWTAICEANLKHYNEHPTRHKTIMVAYGVVTVVAVNKVARKIATEKPELRSGQYS